MSGKKIGYIRVSTLDQNPERQLADLQLDKKFIDHATGTKKDRPQLNALLEYIREEDILYVHSLDRLARNMEDILELIKMLTKKGVEIRFQKENLVFNGKDSALSKLNLMILGGFAEYEAAIIRERSLEGIARAKAKGKYKGKPTKLTKEMEEKIEVEFQTRKPAPQIAKELGIGRSTLWKYWKMMQAKKPKGLEQSKVIRLHKEASI